VQDYLDENGKSVGHFETAGFRPTFMDKFRIHGIELPQDLFQKG
jgi:pilus assembly protein CpaF